MKSRIDPSASWSRMDIAEAWYCFASECHGGQWSVEYEIFARLEKLKFRPSPMLNSDKLEFNSRMIYDSLVDRWKAKKEPVRNRYVEVEAV